MTHNQFEILQSRITCDMAYDDIEYRRSKARYWTGYTDCLLETGQIDQSLLSELRNLIEIRFRDGVADSEINASLRWR